MALTIHGPLSRGSEGLVTIMNDHQTTMQKSLERVSTGLKINHSGDDAAGKAISDKMLAQIRGLDQGQENTQNANSMLNVASAAVSSMIDIIRAMRTKALEAANDSLSEDDRIALTNELNQLKDQVTSSALTTYNGRYLLTGNYGAIDEAVTYDSDGVAHDSDGSTTKLSFTDISWNSDDLDRRLYFQVGPEKDAVITANLMNMTAEYIFSDVKINVASTDEAAKTARSLDTALTRALYQQAEIGSIQERLEYTSENLQLTTADTTDALSTIQDADLAKEMTNYVKNNVLSQATQAMMAQANTSLATFIDLIRESIV